MSKNLYELPLCIRMSAPTNDYSNVSLTDLY